MTQPFEILGMDIGEQELRAASKAIAALPAAGFHVKNEKLVDAGGNIFVMRGINHLYAYYPSERRAIPDIRSAGANTVRVVLTSGKRKNIWQQPATPPSEISRLISECQQNKLLCIFDVQDTTGHGSKDEKDSATIAEAVNYWLTILMPLKFQENSVIVNIANEPFNTDNPAWKQQTIDAIQRLRAAGIEHAIMVDAPGYGQDTGKTMLKNANEVFNSDPLQNIIFSVHMYSEFQDVVKVARYLTPWKQALVIGEFGWKGDPRKTDSDDIMSWAETNGLSYLGWGWSGNGSNDTLLDMCTKFQYPLTGWGERFVNGDNGLKKTKFKMLASF